MLKVEWKPKHTLVTSWIALLLGWILYTVVPFAYVTLYADPPKDALEQSVGTLVVKPFSKGVVTAVEVGGESMRLGCKSDAISRDRCLHDPDNHQGKRVVVTWYWQPLYPFVSQRRVVDMKLETGEVLIDGNKIQRTLEVDREYMVFMVWAFGLACMGLAYSAWLRYKRREE